MKSIAIALTAACTLCAASNVTTVETLQTFKAEMFDKLSTDLGGMKMDTEMTGTLYVDSNLRRTRVDFKTLKMVIKMGAGGSGLRRLLAEGDPLAAAYEALSAHRGPSPGFSGRALLQSDPFAGTGGTTGGTTGGQMGGTAGGDITIELKGGGTELLRYDLKKNFTWFTEGSKTECTCVDLDGEMEPFFVDPFATKAAAESITINGVAVTADKYTSSLVMGMSLEVNYYVEAAKKHLRRLAVQTSLEGISFNTTFDMWNIKETIDSKDWQPHPKCTCPTKTPVKIDVAPATAYEVTVDSCSAKSGCKCIPASATGNDGLTFCKDIVTYPVQKSIFAKTKDDFVKAAYDGHILVMGTKTDSCKTKLKNFLCKFYFQTCFENGVVKLPPQLDASCSAGLLGGDEFSGYEEAKLLAQGFGADGTRQFSAATSLHLSALTVVLAIAALLV
jgi:hypothetical protein